MVFLEPRVEAMSRFTKHDVDVLRQLARSLRDLDRLRGVEHPSVEEIDEEERAAYEVDDLARRLDALVDDPGGAIA